MLPPIGTLFCGHYELTSVIRQGGMGAVYRAFDRILHREVAIKMMLLTNEPPHDEAALIQAQQAILHEARVQARLEHPAIVPVLAADSDPTTHLPYIVMPLMRGSLADLLMPPIAPSEVVRWLAPIAQALDFLHQQQFIHRDLKPSNILVDQHEMPKLADFGIVKDVSTSSTTRGIGTPPFMAPEQWQTPTRLSPATDVYALGLVAYYLLTATLPFGHTPALCLSKNPKPLKRHMPSLPLVVNEVIMKALERNPTKRYARASEMITALQTGLANISSGTPLVPPSAQPTLPAPSGLAVPLVSLVPLAALGAAVETYLSAVEAELQRGNATEHTYRPLLKTLFEACAPDIIAINEPRRINCGAPDLLIESDRTPLGYIEAKDVGKNLAHTIADSERSAPRTPEGKQLARYRAALTNLLYTDGLVWHWFVQGKPRLHIPVTLATWNGTRLLRTPDRGQQWGDVFARFLASPAPTISTPRELAMRMAQIARLLDTATATVLANPDPNSMVVAHYHTIQTHLLPDISPADFADLYAQTIAYGLFAARVIAPDGVFTLSVAVSHIPDSIPLLKYFFSQIASPFMDEGVQWIIEDLVRLLAATDMAAVLVNFGQATMQHDPIVHFYETFLAAYDPRLRESRGVYYTPAPVVSYLTRSVDHLLKRDFGKPHGLVAEEVIILDPATGTGTFLHAIVREIHAAITRTMAGAWRGYMQEKLLPRLYGFELLMAPYVIAHLNLFLLLRELGTPLRDRQRMGIYLTNTLAEAPPDPTLPGLEYRFVQEAQDAAAIKHTKPVMVVIGNPPYAGHSVNVSDWITHLIDDYKKVDGGPLGERNLKWLQDDYVKFIRFAQWRISETGSGIVAFISNNGYVDNPTFRGMRQSLLQTFDAIYLLNLHGSSKKKECAPDGTSDENVFDIQQGVTLGIFVRKPGRTDERPATVHYADVWGKRASKYGYLDGHDVRTTEWTTLHPTSPWYLFVPQNTTLLTTYEQWWKITDIFPINSVGIVTARDSLTIQWNEADMMRVVRDFSSLPVEEARMKYHLGNDVRDWSVARAQEDIRHHGISTNFLAPILYRPFDVRTTYYTGQTRGFICMPRSAVMQHMQKGENKGLLTIRQQSEHNALWSFVSVAETIVESCAISNKTKEITHFFPLYLYPNGHEHPMLFDYHNGRRPNLSATFVQAMEAAVGIPFIPDGMGERTVTFGPEDVFHYIYAVLHHPVYRTRYADLLKRDFPRIPLPTPESMQFGWFYFMCDMGKRLVDLHLLRPHAITASATYPIDGTSEVVRVSYEATTYQVFINPMQYFDNVPPAAWNMRIGGYHPARKWLEDRKGRTLSFDDIQHYLALIAALAETHLIMQNMAALNSGGMF